MIYSKVAVISKKKTKDDNHHHDLCTERSNEKSHMKSVRFSAISSVEL